MAAREQPSMRFIRQCVRTRDYRITRHATQQRLARRITITAPRMRYYQARSLSGILMMNRTLLAWCWVG